MEGMTPDGWIHVFTSLVGAVAVAIAFYVSYRMLQMKEWFRTEMTSVVKENCAGKVEFEAHCETDEIFQQNILASLEKGEASADAILQAKFETVAVQVAAVGQRVDHLTAIVEKRMA